MAKVYVYPDGEQYDEPPTWKSDDYEVREGGYCETCDEELTIHYAEPFASCRCGKRPWELSVHVRAEGEPNFYFLQGTRWLARVQFNGELMPDDQEQLAREFAGILERVNDRRTAADD